MAVYFVHVTRLMSKRVDSTRLRVSRKPKKLKTKGLVAVHVSSAQFVNYLTIIALSAIDLSLWSGVVSINLAY